MKSLYLNNYNDYGQKLKFSIYIITRMARLKFQKISRKYQREISSRQPFYPFTLSGVRCRNMDILHLFKLIART